MKLWRKLTKVYADLETISQMLHEYNFISRSVDVLIGALQEQVQYHARCNYNTVISTNSTKYFYQLGS